SITLDAVDFEDPATGSVLSFVTLAPGELVEGVSLLAGTSNYDIYDDPSGSNLLATGTINVSFTPNSIDDSALTFDGNTVNIPVLSNDNEPNGLAMSVEFTSTPSNGFASINADNTVDYTPDVGFTGTDSFGYMAINSQNGFDTAKVTVDSVVTSQTIQSATGTGDVVFETNSGGFSQLTPLDESTLPASGKPGFAQFAHGFFSYDVLGLSPGETITVTQTFPQPIPDTTRYWKLIDDEWRDATEIVGSNNGDNVLTLTITDNGQFDANPTQGEISDPGGPGLLNNGQIAFQTLRDGNSEIYSMNLDGTGQTRLTNHGASDFDPAWSPDGTKIAFSSQRDGNSEIYIMNADGTGLTRLTNDPEFDSGPAWSPDGSKIAFRSFRDGNQEIYTMNVDGSDLTNITNDPAFDGDPAWSPDGAKIAFLSDRDGNGELYTMNTDGTGIVKIPNTAGFSSPNWSLDGSKITFSKNDAGNIDIYTVNPDGTGQTRITNDPAVDSHPAWSPDGTKITFYSQRDDNNEIHTMNADGTGIINLSNNVESDSNPSWGTNTVILNTAPVASDDSAMTNEETAVTIDVLGNDSDIDGDTPLLDSFDATSANGGSIVLDDNLTPDDASDDLLVYTPTTDFDGLDSFDYVVSDGSDTDTGTVNVDVVNTIESVQSATGTGLVTFSVSDGEFAEPITALAPDDASLPDGKPDQITFEHGLFSWLVTGLDLGETITITETYPDNLLDTSTYWKATSNPWQDITSSITSNDGDNVIARTIQDGGPLDADGSVNGEISDPSGPAADITPPTLTSASISSDNADSTLATAGDTVTVTFTASETISTPTVTIDGNTADSVTNTAGDTWTATRTMQTGDTEGQVPFNISFSDTAGNAGTPVSATTDGSSVTFDETPPAISSVSFTPTSGTQIVGQTIAMTISSDDTGYTAGAITVNGESVTGFTDNGDNTYDVTYTVSEGDADRADSEQIPVSVILTDPAGNSNTAFTTSPDATASPAIDANSPTFSNILPTASTTIDSITTSSDVSYTISEALSEGKITVTYISGPSDDNSPHVCNFVGFALNSGAHDSFDMSDNVNSCSTEPTLVDTAVYEFRYEGTDLAGNTANIVTVTDVTYDKPNSPPVAADDSDNTRKNTSQIMNVKKNDDDADSDPLSVTILTGPTSGTAQVNSDNTITYTPNTDFTGSDSIEYEVSDGNGGTDTALVSIGILDPVDTSFSADCELNGDGPDPGGDDGDYVCKNWEQDGSIQINKMIDSDFNEIDISSDPFVFTCDANTCKGNEPDVFVEVDWMPNHEPNRTMLDEIEAAFAAQGVDLHIEKSENIEFHSDTIEVPGSDPLDPLDFVAIKENFFGNPDERDNHSVEYLVAKRQIFHYALFIHNQQGTDSSGWAEIIGNDFVISLGSFQNGVGSNGQQQGTFMHELGHNMELYHGGSQAPDLLGDGIDATDESADNCKPNYLSVMSYSFQTPDYLADRPLDFSQSKLGDLVEDGGLDESAGVDASTPAGLETLWGTGSFEPAVVTGTAIDWNKDGNAIDTGISQNINYPAIEGCDNANAKTTLTGFNDWVNLNYNLRDLGNFGTGLSTPASELIEITPDTILDMRLALVDTTLNVIDALSDDVFAGDPAKSEAILDSKLNEIRNLVATGDLESAIQKIEELRMLIDDLIIDEDAKNVVLVLLDNMQAAYEKALIAEAHDSPKEFDFGLSVSPGVLSLLPNDSGTAGIGISLWSGDSESVSLSVSGLSTGIISDITPDTVLPTGSATLNINTDDTVSTGVHTITINAVSDTTSKTAVFELKIITTQQALENIIENIASSSIDIGISDSLTSKIDATIDSLERDNQNSACGQLDSFVNEVDALAGEKFTEQKAGVLVDLTSSVQQSIGC
ncbi:tandem-95 repeat protein, partial [Candidatus Bathyarchaeota archaeon]|nr:tandem-95 repeat protein [Candidatus Bathyarchaeota archaeon]